MKTRNGLPTKKAIEQAAEATNFWHNKLDGYLGYSRGLVLYSGERQVARADAFADLIRSAGFEVEHRPYVSDMARCGVVQITPKEPA